MSRDITMKQVRIVTVVCAFSLSMAQVKAEDQFLVDEGKAYAEIIISESPARSTRLAAAELQTYVAKISGTRLPIRADPSVDVPVQIYVGESPHAAKIGVTAARLEHGAYPGPARTLEGIGRTGCGIVPAKKQLETRGQTNSRYQVSLFERQSRGFTLCSGELVWSNFERKTRISPVNQTS